MGIITKIFGDANEKYLKHLQPIVEKINSLEPKFEKLSDGQMKEKTRDFKEKLKTGQGLDDILPEAFALVREASKRTLGQRHFDVQMIGGIVLHQGKIAEMKTGEGKTLAATLPLYLNALEGKGTHLITVNDYLAKRDTVWMGQIYHLLGLSVGCITHEAAFLYDSEYQVENSKFQIPPKESALADPTGQANSKQIQNSKSPVSAKASAGKQIPNGERDKERDLLGGFKIIESYLRPVSRKEAYLADITYGTNNEFGFDYLRDNMVYDLKDRCQREFTQLNNFTKGEIAARPGKIALGNILLDEQHLTGVNYAIIDEVDSILIDEARTPLIISSPDIESSKWYQDFARIIPRLNPKTDYEIDEKTRTVTLTEAGINKIEKILGMENIYQEKGVKYLHHLEQAMRAQAINSSTGQPLFAKDRDYVVKDGQVIIIDEFTGRLMPGRRWSGGLHQAIEAKERVAVKQESLTLASITFQNYFRLYQKLAGMTGTAATSAEEFDKVYKLGVIIIPTNKPLIRQSLSDSIYKTEEGKFGALLREIKERHQKGQPVLVGTRSVEKNEYLGKLLEREGIAHQILNAKHHEREGEIIAQAGKLGSVTVATNMAGRGVDIILGGNPPNLEEQKKIIGLGGLHVIGTERHEARRIDNQLRGRSGRQGDPGSSQFFVSLEDDLMRIFGGDRIKALMETLRVSEDQPIEAKMVSRAIESAQAKIEGMNFDLRKHILDYDDVMNKHREVFYKKRRAFLEISNFPGRPQADSPEGCFPISKQIPNSNDRKLKNENKLRNYILDIIKKAGFTEEDYLKREKEVGEGNMRQMEKFICLRVMDSFWLEHLENMEEIRDSVRLRAYGQQDPLVEYKREGHKMFQQLLQRVEAAIANAIFRAELKPKVQNVGAGFPRPKKGKVGRNDPCPCGKINPQTGKPIKYKKCCYLKFG